MKRYSGVLSWRIFLRISVLLFLSVAATGLPPPGSWDDYDDDLFAAAAAMSRAGYQAMPPPKSWDDYEDDLFADAAKKGFGQNGWPRYRPSWWSSNRGRISPFGLRGSSGYDTYGIPSFMKPIHAPFMGRKSNEMKKGRTKTRQFRPRPLRPILHTTYNGRNVMF